VTFLLPASKAVPWQTIAVWIWSRMLSSFPGHARQDRWLVIVGRGIALMSRARSATWRFAQCTSWRGAVGPHPSARNVAPHPSARNDLQWYGFRMNLLLWLFFPLRIKASYYYLQTRVKLVSDMTVFRMLLEHPVQLKLFLRTWKMLWWCQNYLHDIKPCPERNCSLITECKRCSANQNPWMKFLQLRCF
jgi:hypothetical protein